MLEREQIGGRGRDSGAKRPVRASGAAGNGHGKASCMCDQRGRGLGDEFYRGQGAQPSCARWAGVEIASRS